MYMIYFGHLEGDEDLLRVLSKEEISDPTCQIEGIGFSVGGSDYVYVEKADKILKAVPLAEPGEKNGWRPGLTLKEIEDTDEMVRAETMLQDYL